MITRIQAFFSIALAWIVLSLSAHASSHFLKPEEAFQMTADASDGKYVMVNWHIADGYYLYQSKFRFSSDNAEVQLGDPDMPPSKTKDDPVFGEVEIYRNDITIAVPIEKAPAGLEMLNLKVRSQGCADDGICYPPRNQNVLIALNPAIDAPPPVAENLIEELEATGTSAGGADPLAELAALSDDLGLDEEDDILSPEQAFQFSAMSRDGKSLQLLWNIADGTYLYQDKVKINVIGDGVVLGEYELPKPDIKENSIKPDGSIGDVPVYHEIIDLDIPLLRSNTGATEIEVAVGYQGCADRGICYPPQKSNTKISLPAIAAAEAATLADTAVAADSTQAMREPAQQLSEQDEIASMMASEGYLMVIGVFFLIGLGLAFTPCVFPMIPILSGIITGHGTSITTRKAFMLSLVYVLAMAVAYTIAGVAAALLGENIQAALQNPVAISIFAAIFVLLALSMFGFYDIQLPSSIQSRLAEISNKQEGGSLAGAAVMGFLSALIVGPCVAPPLAGALIYIGQSGDAVLGGAALFAMSMGMGAPLIAIGTSAGKILPRAGHWMDAVKGVFGVVMLGVAIYLLERIISTGTAMALWGILLITSAIYMGALKQLDNDASGWSKLWKGIGVAMMIYGALFLVGVAAGGKDTVQPLRGVIAAGGGGSSAEAHLNFKRIKTVDDLQNELAAAKAAGKPVMLDFYADWCVYCIQMEKDTFPDAKVQSELSNFILLQADVTENDDADKALQQHIGIPAPPAMIFWNTQGMEEKHLRLLGFMGPEEFAPHVSKVK